MLFILWFARKLFGRRKQDVDRGITAKAAPAPNPVSRPLKPDWQRVLTASLEQNSVAPPDETILHSYDLYRDALYAPLMERRHAMAVLHAEITADVEALQALAPGLVERALAHHPFEFSHLEHKEQR